MMTTFSTSREIPATLEQVFAAIRQPERLARWWGPAGFSNTFKVCEFKSGGRWSFVMHGPDGRDYPNESVFAEVEPPRKLVVQHVSEPKFRLTIALAPSEKGTLVSWSQAFESPEVAKHVEPIVVPANEQNLDRLTAEVLRGSTSHKNDRDAVAPEHTAVRVALWRALHVEVDPKPHILTDEIGLKLVAEAGWRSRPDMHPEGSKQSRASIVARARFVEDLIEEQVGRGVRQYVILGAGLDTFTQRRPELASRLEVFEVDQPGPQAWKRKRLHEIGYDTPPWLHFVPVDFEAGQSWWDQLRLAGFNPAQPAVVVSTGVSMYLSREANLATLKQMASLAPGSTFAMTFLLALDLLGPEERSVMEFVMKKTREAGTPFLSLFAPADAVDLAKEAGFENPGYVSAADLYQRYFAGRSDGLHAGSAEAFLVATR